ncbi:Mu transposase C-terminal domain-containing protein [Cryobacterium sp. TMT1-66-1]|uniref:Mu transposase C-terminal domain-containing protein n=1 Tax=Cryobacterium sp. TMT1-66-1 TaxID=1259242 RepID=UPI00141AE912|nr:Mu transposase C-terminal domain-containing protein [Cryobacterium sp. TMT1-66-1]
MVLISNPDGSHATEVPAAEIAVALRGDAPPPDLAHLHDIEERLTVQTQSRLKEDSDLLHIMLTGRRADQPDTDRPGADLDPALVPEGLRRRTLARLLAEKARDKGKRKGFNVLHRSEMRRLQRIMKRWRDEQNLLDGRYTRPRTWRTDDEVVDSLLTFMNDHALKSTKSDFALVRAFRIFCAKEKPSLVLPSTSTLRRRVQEMRGGWSHLGASAKNRISEVNVPKSSGTTRLATRPGELVLFDTTKANVWVKDPRTDRVFRLDVTLAIDLATRCVVGLAITHTTTKFAIGLCLADVLRPKTAALAAEWTNEDSLAFSQPFVGRPDAFVSFYSAAFHPEGVVVDNGKQYVSTYVTAQMGRLGIHYEPQRSYTPTDKAQVERVFRTIKDMFEALMPGFTGGSVHEKGENPQAEQLMSPAEFERRLRQCIDLYNHRTHQGLVLPEDPFARLSPFTMYGILAEKVGAIPDIQYEHDWVRFLPSVTAKISPSRVRVKRLNYQSPVLRRLQGDPVVMKTGKLRIFYDPFDLRITWCFDAEGSLHPLRWHYLTEHTPRFGEFHTNHVVEKFADKKVSSHSAERILVEIFAGKYDDGALEAIRHEELADNLMQARAASLTDSARNSPPQQEALIAAAQRAVPRKALPSPVPPIRPEEPRNLVMESPPSADSRAADAVAEQLAAARAPRARRALQPYNQNRF